MKKMLIMVAMATLILGLTQCKKKDRDIQANWGSIAGVWKSDSTRELYVKDGKQVGTYLVVENPGVTVDFRSDGSFVVTEGKDTEVGGYKYTNGSSTIEIRPEGETAFITGSIDQLTSSRFSFRITYPVKDDPTMDSETDILYLSR